MRFQTFMENVTPRLEMSYEIPYLAGYSKDGKIVFIDKRINRLLNLKDGRKIDVVPFIVKHETIEKQLMDNMGYKYQYAHEKATKAERDAVIAAGYPWPEYQKYVLDEYHRLKNLTPSAAIPHNLDMKPEIDTHDTAELSVIKKHQ